MQRIYSMTPLSGLFKKLDMITATMAVDSGYFKRGARIYLVRPDLIDNPTCQCLIHGRLRIWEHNLPWEQMRFVEVRSIESQIAERCWRGSPEEMESLVQEITDRYHTQQFDFGVDV